MADLLATGLNAVCGSDTGMPVAAAEGLAACGLGWTGCSSAEVGPEVT